eukprot:jgi/Chrzof1/13245/Cz07g25300.t1
MQFIPFYVDVVRRSPGMQRCAATSPHLGSLLGRRTTPASRNRVCLHSTSRQKGQTITEVDHQEEQNPGPLASVVNFLLYRAASRLERGHATCLACKGQGTCACPNCKGEGLVSKEEARMNTRHKTDWLMTNRCQKCHGQGQVICTTCNGVGVRNPGVRPPR